MGGQRIQRRIAEVGPFALYTSRLHPHARHNHRVIYDLRTGRPVKYFEPAKEGWTDEQQERAERRVRAMNADYLDAQQAKAS